MLNSIIVKIFISFLLASMLPIGILITYHNWANKNIIYNLKKEELKTHACRFSETIDQELSMRKDILQDFYNKCTTKLIGKEIDSPVMKRQIKRLIHYFNSSESIFILDTKGDIVVPNKNNIQTNNYATRNFFKKAIHGDTYVSEPAVDQGKGYIYYSTPLRNNKQETIGVLAMRRKAEELWKLFTEEKDFLGKGSLCILTDGHGVMIAHTLDRSLIFSSWIRLKPDVKNLLEAEHHYGEDVRKIGFMNIPEASKVLAQNGGLHFIHPLTIDTKIYHGYCIPLKEKDWILIYTVPSSVFLAPIKQLTHKVIFSTGITFLVVMALTWLLSASFVQPIKRLNSAATEIANGDLEYAVIHGTQDEIGSLIHVFEMMRDKLKDSYKELKDANIEAILMLARACEVRDEDTGNHALRINHYSVALAKEMGLEEPFINELAPSSILHDVGKLHIPDYVLRKKWYFTDKEKEVMEKHPLFGEKILSGGNQFFKMAREIARWHHENWDGTGYPDGLQGDAIPVSVRIVRLADTYDALVNKRPYKDAWSNQAAYDEIVKHSGTFFDPKVVEAFMRLFKKGVFQQIQSKYT